MFDVREISTQIK